MYVVILAGGGGTRLWPLSRPDHPKPFLPLLGDESLLQRTVRRVAPLVGHGDIFCVTDQRYGRLVRDQVPDVELIVEPLGKNTAAAVALATARIQRPDDEVMLVLAADHWIGDEAAFREVLQTATAKLAGGALGIDEPLITLGARPTHPSTDYGYLRPDTTAGATVDGLPTYPLLAFEEKPVEARARELMNLPGVAWNAGMFAWRRGVIRAALERYTPLMTVIGPLLDSGTALAAAYERLQPISIDRAVMESAARDRRVLMGTLDVGWSDIGSWAALLDALGMPGIDARILQPGESAEATANDLVVERKGDRLLAVPGADGTITAYETLALLKGARRFEAQVDDLLARCSGAQRV
jgi:mannose-1-phosphate guanylyltransferase